MERKKNEQITRFEINEFLSGNLQFANALEVIRYAREIEACITDTKEMERFEEIKEFYLAKYEL